MGRLWKLIKVIGGCMAVAAITLLLRGLAVIAILALVVAGVVVFVIMRKRR